MDRTLRWLVILAIAGASSGLARGQDTSPAAEAPAALSEAEVDALLDQFEREEPMDYDAYQRLERAIPHAARIVPRVVKMLNHPKEEKVGHAAFLLMALGPAARDAAEPLLRKLGTLAHDDTMPELLMRALAAIGAPPEKIGEAFKKTLSRKSSKEHASAYYSIGLFRHDRAGAWSPHVLAAALEAPEGSTRLRVAEELGLHGPRSLPALRALLSVLAADYPSKGQTKDPSAEVIASSYGEGAHGIFSKPGAGGWALSEQSFLEYRNAYVWALARIGPAAKGAVKTLIDVASSGHIALRPDAIRALAMIDPGSPAVQKLARQSLEHPNPFIRLAGEDAIRLLGSRATQARKELVKRLADARPYELRAIFRAIEAIGWEDPPVVADLVAAVRKKKPDGTSIAAAHRLGMVERPDGSIVTALKEGVRSNNPALACASALSLGRLVPSPPEAAKDLVAVLKPIELTEEMDVWEATKAAYLVEALGRHGLASSEALVPMTRMIRALKEQYWGVLTVSGLNEREIARACWMIRPPPYMLHGQLAADAATKSDPPWYADWALDPPDAGVVLWMHQPSPTHVLLEYGNFPEMHADWSTVSRSAFDDSVLLSLRREEDGVDLRLLEFDRAVTWALQRDTETRPTDLYKLECRMKPADLDSAERLDLDFRGREIKDAEYFGQKYPSYRWRGGFSIPNPFRKAPK